MFRDMFAQMDNFAQEIIIEDTTAPAFRILIYAIYCVKTIQESLKGKTVDEIFAVLYLVTKYDIPELVQAVKDTLASFPLTVDTVLEVAGDAMDYSSTFQEEAQKLLLACAKFLKNKLTRSSDVFQLIAENGDRLEVIHKLAVLVKENYLVPVIKMHGRYFGPVGPVRDVIESSGEDTDEEVLVDIGPAPGLSSDDEDSEDSLGDSSNYLTG